MTWPTAATAAGCFLLFGSTDTSTFMVGLVLFQVAAALLLLAVVQHRGTLVARVLRCRPLVHAGVISYGLYLWNSLPLDALGLYGGGRPMGWDWRVLVCLAATVAVAEASWRWVEAPVIARTRTWLAQRKARLEIIPRVPAQLAAGVDALPAAQPLRANGV